MKHGFPWCVAGMVAIAQIAAGARVEPPLPEWRQTDRELLEAGGLLPGSVLLGKATPGTEADGTHDSSEGVVAMAMPAPEPGEESEEVEESATTIPEEFLDDYFARKPAALLVDPQQLLSRQEYRDRNEFLRYHSRDSAIDFIVYLFDAEQEIPGEEGLEKLVGQFFADGKPTAVVAYFVGAPQRAQVVLSPQLSGLVSRAECRRAAERSIARALEKADPVDQLEGFAVQMSIRLYWMEKMLGAASSRDELPLVVLSEHEKGPSEQDRSKRIERARELVMRWLEWILGGAGCMAALGLGFWLWRRFFRYRFPQIEVAPRLGGEYGAGIGAVVSFASASLPPSVQRKHMPDYLREL